MVVVDANQIDVHTKRIVVDADRQVCEGEKPSTLRSGYPPARVEEVCRQVSGIIRSSDTAQ